MTFEAFIKRTSDGKEVDFEHNFEREPVTQIARSLHNQFSQVSKYYALLANVVPSQGKGNTRQLDAILLSEDGMSVSTPDILNGSIINSGLILSGKKIARVLPDP